MSVNIEFQMELASAINRCSMENGSNTPDFILAGFLKNCLFAFNGASRERERWYGQGLSIGGNGKQPSEMARHIAARVWCDQDMKDVAMDVDAAECIARIIDSVLSECKSPTEQPMIVRANP